ncbi:MAG: hypothetical protein A2149_05425 [Candidatus Schekmanbacteria bacterium RBG_16_38_11]|uniref:Uncharacterized protein n=1 Tax=Candidatus Schekmanbacteria bacterium RBG_16_38_11 TaxID=1817880 RepID=A0A1F7S046_9BACT|nr:MAG: hypothetical protein A2149_05425 [Candidatus Schekmanbacteria bacterium RBG_16_38_11]
MKIEEYLFKIKNINELLRSRAARYQFLNIKSYAVIPHLMRNPGFPVKTGIQFILMVPRFRGDDDWIPAFAGMTMNTNYTPKQSFEEF